MTTIYIMWLRQLKRYFRSRSRILGSLGQPLLFLLALGFGFGPVFSQAGQGNYMQFLAPGIITMSIVFTSIFSGMEIIWDRQFGFLKETLVAPVSRLNIMLGRTLGGATVATIQGIIVLMISLVAGFRPVSLFMLIPTVLFMALVGLLFTALGTAIASLLEDMQAFPIIMNFLVMPLIFVSGAIFPLQGLSGAIALVARVNPLSYGVDGLRYMLSGLSAFSLATDISIMVGATLACLFLGSYFFSKIEI